MTISVEKVPFAIELINSEINNRHNIIFPLTKRKGGEKFLFKAHKSEFMRVEAIMRERKIRKSA
jgi:hypothetical protein